MLISHPLAKPMTVRNPVLVARRTLGRRVRDTTLVVAQTIAAYETNTQTRETVTHVTRTLRGTTTTIALTQLQTVRTPDHAQHTLSQFRHLIEVSFPRIVVIDRSDVESLRFSAELTCAQVLTPPVWRTLAKP